MMESRSIPGSDLRSHSHSHSKSSAEAQPEPAFHIERGVTGYVVRGDGADVWRPTLDSALEVRDAMEPLKWRQRPLPRRTGRRSRPPGAVAYGPVQSRRFGRSLGVNLMRPGLTECSFRCVYCEYPRQHCLDPFGDWPTPAGVAMALERAFTRYRQLDSITISGCGEPTRHPQFSAVVGRVLYEARRAQPGVPVRILTNGERAFRPEVRAALDRLDERIVTLDADPERADRPRAHAPLGGIVQGISLLRDFTAQSCFFDGAVSNVGDAAVRRWAELVGELCPRSVQIFTLSRRPAAVDVRPVRAEQLEEIACVLRARTGIEGVVFG
jgi:wyosine [tRNA(Phe)-imidazoG37] synthetase (radical SAM superfamily)